jgi:hypothetical protein
MTRPWRIDSEKVGIQVGRTVVTFSLKAQSQAEPAGKSGSKQNVASKPRVEVKKNEGREYGPLDLARQMQGVNFNVTLSDAEEEGLAREDRFEPAAMGYGTQPLPMAGPNAYDMNRMIYPGMIRAPPAYQYNQYAVSSQPGGGQQAGHPSSGGVLYPQQYPPNYARQAPVQQEQIGYQTHQGPVGWNSEQVPPGYVIQANKVSRPQGQIPQQYGGGFVQYGNSGSYNA